jgi:hypothetical protein
MVADRLETHMQGKEERKGGEGRREGRGGRRRAPIQTWRAWASILESVGRASKGWREGKEEIREIDHIHLSSASFSLTPPSLPPSLPPCLQTQFIEVDCGKWPRVALTIDEPEKVCGALSKVRWEGGREGREGGREGNGPGWPSR